MDRDALSNGTNDYMIFSLLISLHVGPVFRDAQLIYLPHHILILSRAGSHRHPTTATFPSLHFQVDHDHSSSLSLSLSVVRARSIE